LPARAADHRRSHRGGAVGLEDEALQRNGLEQLAPFAALERRRGTDLGGSRASERYTPRHPEPRQPSQPSGSKAHISPSFPDESSGTILEKPGIRLGGF